MTNQQLIDKALAEINVLTEGDSASAAQSSVMLTQLNQMMAMWSVNDMDLQFPPQDTLGDTAPIPSWAELGVIASLGILAAPTFAGGVVTNVLMDKARLGVGVIQKVLLLAKLKPVDLSYLPAGSGRYSNSNSILTDE